MSVLGRLLRDLGAASAKWGARMGRHYYARARWSRNLPALALYFGTDKWGSHWYAAHYQTHFAALRRKRLRLLEIGVGGEEDPQSGGASLRMWKAYFPNARIYGLDIADKSPHDESRIKTFQGSQDDEGFLRQLSHHAGPFDIVIDDGSHINAHVIGSFGTLFPLLSEHGIYVVEDTQTAYWGGKYGGGAPGDASAPTSMNFLKSLIDGLNHREFQRGPDFNPGYLERHIVSMHFYHNMVFVQKGLNDELSNIRDSA
jgi:hypothetical protein